MAKKIQPRQKKFNSRTNEGLSPTLTTSPTLAHQPMLTQIDLGKVMDYFPVFSCVFSFACGLWPNIPQVIF